MAGQEALKKEPADSGIFDAEKIHETVKEALSSPSHSPSETTGDVIHIEKAKERRSEATITAETSLDMLLDIPLTLAVELGRSKVKINDLLELGQGSVLELNKLSGEPLDIIVNEKLIARGEVVVINEKFGVRITEIVSQSERVENLK